MKLKKISALLSVLAIAVLVTVYYTSVGFTEVQSNSAIYALTDSSNTNPVYTCPMHPGVTSDEPGKCPKCGMDLVLKTDDNSGNKMTCCMDKDKCIQMGCDTNNCKGMSGACKEGCRMMKDGTNKDVNKDCMNKGMMKDGKCNSKCTGK